MTRAGIISVIILIGLGLLTFAMVESCHSGNEPPIGNDIENEELIRDPERAPAEEAVPIEPVPLDPAGADTAAADTTDGVTE